MAQKHPDGSVQAISSAAMTMFALLIAYLGYTSLKSQEPWHLIDLWIQIVPSFLAGISLILVPWLATKSQEADLIGVSVGRARTAFITGAVLALFAILAPLIRDFIAHH